MKSGTSNSGSQFPAHPLIEVWRERKAFLGGILLFGLVLWQAFRGQSIAQPDGLTLESFAVWLMATAIAVVVISSKQVAHIFNAKEGIS